MFLKSGYSMRIVTILYDHAGSGKLKMAAIKAEIPMHPLVDKIALTFQRLCFVFRVQLSIFNFWNTVLQNRKT